MTNDFGRFGPLYLHHDMVSPPYRVHHLKSSELDFHCRCKYFVGG